MKYLLTLLWLLDAIAAQAQEYTGHVADKEDGAAVAGAIVTAPGLPGQAAGLHDDLGLGRFRAQAARGRDNRAARLLDDGLPPAVGSGQRRADARAADARDDPISAR